MDTDRPFPGRGCSWLNHQRCNAQAGDQVAGGGRAWVYGLSTTDPLFDIRNERNRVVAVICKTPI